MTSDPNPTKEWWAAEDLADSGLPDVPGTKRGVNAMAKRMDWGSFPKKIRRKPGRGGGTEYHWTLLPVAARTALLSGAKRKKSQADRGLAWAEFDQLPHKARATAQERLRVLQAIEELMKAGLSQSVATDQLARIHGFHARTIWNWIGMVEGVEDADRLAYLAPKRHKAQRAAAKHADYRAFMDYLKSLYLAPERRTFAQCFREAFDQANLERWSIPNERTALRRLKKEVPRVTQIFAREGLAGMHRCYPAQIRDRTGLTAMEAVNADCHKIDVFVKWPDGTVNRPQIVAFQDLYSGKVLSWRVDHNPNKVMVMAAFGELVETYGIPRRCLFDNGREFANKWMTAGAETRFRFKILDEDPVGVLPLLGIQIHWATPGHGQAKPIERGFRDFASDIAKDPRFAGAYVGNRPDAKPDNYGSHAVPVERFLQVLGEGIEKHNARPGRLSKTAAGRSFDETFAESYATAPIRKATEQQRRLWLMGQQIGKLNANNGEFKAFDNHYYSEWMSEHAGERMVARFDPEDLHAGLWMYSVDGEFMGFAECRQAVGFFDITESKEEARRKRRRAKLQRDLRDAHTPISIEQIQADMDARAPEAPEDLTAKVVSPVFGAVKAPVPHEKRTYETPDNPEVEEMREAMVVEMDDLRKAPGASPDLRPEEQRFLRALDIIDRSDRGERIGKADVDWLQVYRTTPEYQAQAAMREDFGDDEVG
ncbi:MAG: transposase domain-containing protein [Paracoccaceae bacterium]